MAIAAVVIIPIGLLFLVSGLIVNLLQGLSYMPIKKLLKCCVGFLMHLVQTRTLFVLLTWFVLSSGTERALLICNHRSDISWLVGWVLAQASIYLPVIGWSMWFSGFIFLERNWAKVEDTMKSGFEGKSGLPVAGNILIPRTKGFVAAVTHLRSFVPVIYNMTVAIPKSEPPPTLLRLFRGRSSTVHVHIERHLMQELRETNSGIAQWCKDVFVAKVVICWSCLPLLAIVEFFEMYPFSWGEVAFCVIADLNLCIPAKRPTEVDDGLTDVPPFVND
ncbi:hypothetical protein OROHE_004472 [Orobanche hederae]